MSDEERDLEDFVVEFSNGKQLPEFVATAAEEKAKRIYKRFFEAIRDSANEVLEEFTTDLLPYVAEDLEWNVKSWAEREIERFLLGRESFIEEFCSDRVIKKLVDDHAEKLKNERIRKLEDELERKNDLIDSMGRT